MSKNLSTREIPKCLVVKDLGRLVALIVFLMGQLTLLQAQSILLPEEVRDGLRSSGASELIISFDSTPLKRSKLVNLPKKEKTRLVYEHLKTESRRAQAEVRELLDRDGYRYRCFNVANAIWVVADHSLVAALERMQAEVKIFPNTAIMMEESKLETEIANQRGAESPWGLSMVAADEVWEMGILGEGVLVGGMDTGVDWDHPALIHAYAGWDGINADHNYHWHDAIHSISDLHQDSIVNATTNPCGLNVLLPCDDIGSSHGSHTLGTIIGQEGDLTIGMAPKARWIAVRCMERGYGSVATYLEGFEWFLAPTDLAGNNPDPTRAPDVINNSWSCPPKEGCHPENFAILDVAIRNLKLAGITVIVSAGNNGREGCGSISNPPGIFPSSFTVGAVQPSDSLTVFSSRGPATYEGKSYIKPDVSAPGQAVLSVRKGGGYQKLSGTSMAAPHAAGLAALLISANPELSGNPEAIEEIIRETALHNSERDSCRAGARDIPSNYHGYGRIEALGAVIRALDFTQVENHSSNRLILYPNPASTLIQIKLNQTESPSRLDVSVYNAFGQLVMRKKTSTPSNQVDLEIDKLPVGIYFLTVNDEQQTSFIKIR